MRIRRGKRLAKHCVDCGAEINRSSRARCKACARIGLKRAIPDDFLVILRRLGSQGAARHYRSSLSTVTRWRRELKMKPQARMKKGIGQSRVDRGFVARPLIVNRDMSRVGMAAEYLSRFGPIYRCTEEGKPNAKGSHWRRGFAVMSDAGMIERAKRMGWNETQAW